MRLSDMRLGARVRIAITVEIFPTGVFRVGTTGTVVHVEPQPLSSYDTPAAQVRLDESRRELDEWDNRLDVYPADHEYAACTVDHFEAAT